MRVNHTSQRKRPRPAAFKVVHKKAPFDVTKTTLGNIRHGSCPGCVNCGRGMSNR